MSKRNRIICLSGWRGSGKDTVADYLESRYGYKKLSFAAALKDLVVALFPMDRELLDDRVGKELNLSGYPAIAGDPSSARIQEIFSSELKSGFWTPRALCILIGSVMRSVHSNYWVSRVADVMKKNSDMRYVISDMRYGSEADTIKALFPREELVFLRIERFSSIDTTDPSERDLDGYPFDVYLSNRSTTEELHAALDQIMWNLGRENLHSNV